MAGLPQVFGSRAVVLAVRSMLRRRLLLVLCSLSGSLPAGLPQRVPIFPPSRRSPFRPSRRSHFRRFPRRLLRLRSCRLRRSFPRSPGSRAASTRRLTAFEARRRRRRWQWCSLDEPQRGGREPARIEQPFDISCGRRYPAAFLARLDLAHGAEETQADAACIRSQESRGRGVRRRPGSPELPPNGRFRVTGRAGVNRVPFRGRMGRRMLGPGTYRITARTVPRGRAVANAKVVIVTRPDRQGIASARGADACGSTQAGQSTSSNASAHGKPGATVPPAGAKTEEPERPSHARGVLGAGFAQNFASAAKSIRPLLFLLLGIVGAALLIAVVSVANALR